MHVYKYVQAHIIILHQHVSITPMTIIRVFYNKNAEGTTDIQMYVIPINIFNQKQHALCEKLYYVAASSEPELGFMIRP